MKYPNLVKEFLSTPWAIMPDKLAAMTEFMEIAASGKVLSPEEVQARIGAAQAQYAAASSNYASQPGAVAVIPIMGVISQRVGMMEQISGGVSAEALARDIRQAGADESVGAIVLNIDSPGGSVYGIQELANTIREVRNSKKIVAVANSLAASAAYWIASAAEEFVITPGGEAGSIGVLSAHMDASQYYEDMGIKPTLISAGKYKVEANPYQPLNDEAKEFLQSRVDDYYDDFVKAVAKNRGVKVDDVRNGFGQGRTLGAKQAVSEGMADGVETIDSVIARVSTKRGQKTMQANANALALVE